MSTLDLGDTLGDTDTDAGSQYNVPGLERGLRVLAAFSREEPVQDATVLARRLNIPRTTMFRLLQTLETLGFVKREPSGRGYRLDAAVLRLGFEHFSGQDLTELAQPLLEALRDKTGFTAHLLIRDWRDVVFVAKAQSQGSAFGAVKVQVGSRLPAHATTHGLLLMGDLALDGLYALYPENPLQQYTPQTPATVAALFEQVRTSTQRGYATGESSFEHGISVVSAPVYNEEGHIAAVVSVTIPAPRIAPQLIESGLIEQVCDAARELSLRLGHRPRPHAAGAQRATNVSRLRMQ